MEKSAFTRAVLLTSACLAAAWGVLAARRAAACSYPAPPPQLVGYPDAGASGVPTDVRPLYRAYEASFALREASELDPALLEAGRRAPFELVDEAGSVRPLFIGEGGGGYVELVPGGALAPRTRYLVRSIPERSAGAGAQLSFTTGGGPVAALPEPPDVTLEHYTLNPGEPVSSCGPGGPGTCIMFSAPPLESGLFIEAIYFKLGSDLAPSGARLSRTPWITDITGLTTHTPYDCIRLRHRAPNGSRSNAVVACRSDGYRYDLEGFAPIACTPEGITQGDHLVSEIYPPQELDPAVGSLRCSAAPQSSGSRPPSLFALLLPLALRRATKRR